MMWDIFSSVVGTVIWCTFCAVFDYLLYISVDCVFRRTFLAQRNLTLDEKHKRWRQMCAILSLASAGVFVFHHTPYVLWALIAITFLITYRQSFWWLNPRRLLSRRRDSPRSPSVIQQPQQPRSRGDVSIQQGNRGVASDGRGFEIAQHQASNYNNGASRPGPSMRPYATGYGYAADFALNELPPRAGLTRRPIDDVRRFWGPGPTRQISGTDFGVAWGERRGESSPSSPSSMEVSSGYESSPGRGIFKNIAGVPRFHGDETEGVNTPSPMKIPRFTGDIASPTVAELRRPLPGYKTSTPVDY